MGVIGDLFLTFLKIGCFTFGGGYAMIPMIEDYSVERRGWITHDDMMNLTIIAESTPGPIAINCATFVGYKQAGLRGAAAATLGIVLPSFGAILVVALLLEGFMEHPVVANAFRGVQIAVGFLIVDAGIVMARRMEKSRLTIAILACAFAALLLVDLFSLTFSTILMLLAAAAVSFVASGVERALEARRSATAEGETAAEGGVSAENQPPELGPLAKPEAPVMAETPEPESKDAPAPASAKPPAAEEADDDSR